MRERNMEEDYINESFTKTEDKVNLAIDNLNVECITSKNNKFSLDSEGNLAVKSITISDGLKETMVNYVYPIGSIYLSVNEVSPNLIFGGSWEEIEGRFLLGSSTNYPLGSIGGEKDHLLTTNEMPVHTHTIAASGGHSHTANFLEVRSRINGQDSNNVARPNTSSYDSTGTVTTSNGAHSHTVSSTGNGQAHNNMPPYLSVKIWKRIG